MLEIFIGPKLPSSSFVAQELCYNLVVKINPHDDFTEQQQPLDYF